MAEKIKSFEIDIVDKPGSFFRKFTGEKKDYDFDSLSIVRKLLSNEKVRLLNIVKQKSPKSIYELAKLLKRDFKSVNDDVKLLEKFGFLDMFIEKTGKRERLRPVLIADTINIKIKI